MPSEESRQKSTQITLGGNIQTRLVNINEYGTQGVTLIGRSTKFGNQFKMEKDGGEYTRLGCVEAYEVWFYADEQAEYRQQVIDELEGETIGCYCLGEGDKYDANEPISEVEGEPSVCHGEVILRFLNKEIDNVEQG